MRLPRLGALRLAVAGLATLAAAAPALLLPPGAPGPLGPRVAHADVELDDAEQGPCSACAATHEGPCRVTPQGAHEPPPADDVPLPEPIYGRPPGMHGHDLLGGTRSGPFPRIGVDLELLAGELESDFEYESDDGRGHEVRVDRDLPLDDSIGAAELRAWILLGPSWELTASYLRLETEGDGAVERSFVHDAVTFERGDEVEYRVEAQMAWIGARVYGINEPDVKFAVSIGAMWTSQEVLVEHKDRELGEREAGGRVDAYSPYLGLYLDVHFGAGIGVESELRFFAWGDEVDKVFSYVDGRVQVYATVADHVRIWVGLRALGTDYYNAGRNDRSSTWSVGGVTAGASIYF